MSAPDTLADVTADMRRSMPNACADWAERIDRIGQAGAISLRDHFAGQALAAMLGHVENVLDRRSMAQLYAAFAYDVADAMLAERDKVRP